MHIGRINGATRNLGAPPNWNEAKDGPCGVLPVRDEKDGPRMMSAWFPTAAELDALQKGAPVYLHVFSGSHPPVALTVGQSPDEAVNLKR